MSTTVLIPTDFTIESLMLVKQAAALRTHDSMDIIMGHALHLPVSITELLFYTPRKVIKPLVSEDFRQACSILQNKYKSGIQSMKIVLFHGQNNSAFENYVEANNISEAFIPKKYKLKLKGDAFDFVPFIKSAKLPFTEIDWVEKKNIPEKDQLAELFLD